jgi:hypothetical protein
MKKTSIIIMILCLCQILQAQQLYNMGFDVWSKQGRTWNPFPKGASEEQRVWDSANRSMKALGINTTTPEFEHVAVPGPGKAAAKIVSRNITWCFAAGSLYTGQFIRLVNFSGIEMENGTPFKGRPKSLSGYYHYLPGVINYAKNPYLSMKGKTDIGQIEVALYDWPKVLRLDTTEGHYDPEADPHLIGRGVLKLTKATNGYVHFEIPIEYKRDASPTYVGISILSSMLGEYFTGSSNTVLYIDELQFNY